MWPPLTAMRRGENSASRAGTLLRQVSVQTSVAPTVSPAAGAISAATTVTLSDTGANTSVWYTTDGSAPTTSSTLYIGPFSVTPGTTVKAIGMWGAANQPKSYPAGYGYVPSAVVTASYASGSVVQQPTERKTALR